MGSGEKEMLLELSRRPCDLNSVQNCRYRCSALKELFLVQSRDLEIRGGTVAWQAQNPRFSHDTSKDKEESYVFLSWRE